MLTVTLIALASFVAGAVLANFEPVQLSLAQPVSPSFLSILLTNIRVFAILLAGGLFLGVPTVLTLVLNFSVSGWSMAQYVFQGRAATVLTAVAPHFIPETLAYLLVGSIGLLLTRYELNYIKGHQVRHPDKTEYHLLLIWSTVALCLLVFAALIEWAVSHS